MIISLKDVVKWIVEMNILDVMEDKLLHFIKLIY